MSNHSAEKIQHNIRKQQKQISKEKKKAAKYRYYKKKPLLDTNAKQVAGFLTTNIINNKIYTTRNTHRKHKETFKTAMPTSNIIPFKYSTQKTFI